MLTEHRGGLEDRLGRFGGDLLADAKTDVEETTDLALSSTAAEVTIFIL